LLVDFVTDTSIIWPSEQRS